MEYLRMSYLNYFALLIILFSCEERALYEKEFSPEQKKVLSEQLLNGSGNYYQGSAPEQFILEEAASYDMENAAVWRERGVAYLKRGFPQQMSHFYGYAVNYDPIKWQGYRGYMYLYFYRDYGRAIADFNATDSLTKDFVDHPQGQSVDYMRGICYYGLTDYNKALAYLNKYVESVIEKEGENWADPYAVLYRGLTYEKLDDHERAVADFDRALRIYPNLADSFYHKARIAAKAGDYEEAASLLKQAKRNFEQGYFHKRPYVEVLDQIYMLDIENLENEILPLTGKKRTLEM